MLALISALAVGVTLATAMAFEPASLPGSAYAQNCGPKYQACEGECWQGVLADARPIVPISIVKSDLGLRASKQWAARWTSCFKLVSKQCSVAR
jgi:hypothetical protein